MRAQIGLAVVLVGLSVACTGSQQQELPADAGMTGQTQSRADTFQALKFNSASLLPPQYFNESSVFAPATVGRAVTIVGMPPTICSVVAMEEDIRVFGEAATKPEVLAAFLNPDECSGGLDGGAAMTLYLADGRFLGVSDMLNCREGSPLTALRTAAQALIDKYCP